MLYLRQSTASQAVLLGPFVDDTDGATAETGLTIANTDIRLSANGGNMAAKNSGGGTHDENGWYTITLDATDTATVGRLQISCKVAGALAVFMECQVLEENVYDAVFAGSAALGTDVAAILVDTGTTLQGELDGIQADTEDIQGRLPAALVNGRMDSSIDDTGLEAGAVAAINATVDTALTDYDPPTRAELTSDINSVLAKLQAYVQLLARSDAAIATDLSTELGEINADEGSGAGDYDNATDSQEALQAEHDATQSAVGTVDTVADAIQAVTDNLPDSGALSDLAEVLTDTGTTLPALIAALNDLSASEVNAEVVDVLRTDTLPDSVAADGSASTIAQAIYLILQFLTDKAVSGTTLTVRKPDGSTALATFTLDDGDAPTDITRAT